MRKPRRLKALFDGDWKLFAERNDPWELYNLKTDRTESHNLAAEHPVKVKQLFKEYEQWIKRAGVPQWPQAHQNLKPAVEDSPSKD